MFKNISYCVQQNNLQTFKFPRTLHQARLLKRKTQNREREKTIQTSRGLNGFLQDVFLS